MKAQLWTSLIVAAGISSAGCATTEPSTSPGSTKATSGSAMAQFKCADRNGNDYIDQTELVHLRQCGIGEDLTCGVVPDTNEEPPPKTDFELGRGFLQVTDADGDDRISKLEFRAHCNKAGFSE